MQVRRPRPAAGRGRCPPATRRWTREPLSVSVIFIARKSFGNIVFFSVNIVCKFFFLYPPLVFSKMSSENARPCPVVRGMRRAGLLIWGMEAPGVWRWEQGRSWGTTRT